MKNVSKCAQPFGICVKIHPLQFKCKIENASCLGPIWTSESWPITIDDRLIRVLVAVSHLELSVWIRLKQKGDLAKGMLGTN